MIDPGLIAKRKALITDAARELDKAKMMRFDEKSGNLYVTDLGRVASHFYIQYTSVETYNEMLKRHMNEAEVEYFFCITVAPMMSYPCLMTHWYYIVYLQLRCR